MHFPGKKKEDLIRDLILPNIPNLSNYKYVEPFGGTFAVGHSLNTKPIFKIYNDILQYKFKIVADIIENSDYKNIFKKYDSVNTFFYLDPPYYGKEYLYGLENENQQFHIELKELIKSLKGKFLISYEAHPFILELYQEDINFKIIKYTGSNKYHKKEINILKNF